MITHHLTAGAVRSALEDARARGEACLSEWIRNGVLVPGREIEAMWRMTGDELAAACGPGGELFSLWIAQQHWYPSEILRFSRDAFTEVNRALGDCDPTHKLLFLLTTHGALRGLRPARAYVQGLLPDILRAAEVWTSDH